ncbi:MAG: hypothetical protein P0S96_04255 [Simkaniaceae bacterium]|nr:hypothetical protein [Candidatus Sacchlamyda saccharinae]
MSLEPKLSNLGGETEFYNIQFSQQTIDEANDHSFKQRMQAAVDRFLIHFSGPQINPLPN